MSKEADLLTKLMPGHADFWPIIQGLREKYGIPPINPEDDPADILLTRDDIDWEAIKQDIDKQVAEIPLHDEAETKYIYMLKRIATTSLNFPELDVLDENTKKAILNLFSMFSQQADFQLQLLESKTTRPIAEIIWEYLLTGKTRDVPEEWFGAVFTMDLFGKPTIFVMAGEGSNPKELAKQFKGEYTKTFGKKNYNITENQVSTADFLTMHLQGNSYRRLAERYRELHPTEFSTKSNKITERQIDNMKKRVKAITKVVEKIGGDKT